MEKKKSVALLVGHAEWKPTDLPMLVKIANISNYQLKQEPEKLWPDIQHLLKERVIISAIYRFNSPIWPVLKADKNKWKLTTEYCGNLNAVAPPIKAPIFNIIEMNEDIQKSLGSIFPSLT